MNTQNNTRTALHWAFVGAISALIGFLSSRSICALWALNFVWMIVIGMIITTMVFLIAYRPQDLLRAIRNAIEATPGVFKEILDICHQIKIAWHLPRNWRGRMYRYKAMRSTSVWGICFFLTLFSWSTLLFFIGILVGVNVQTELFILVVLITLQRCLTHWIDLGKYIPRLLLENRVYNTDGTYTIVYVNFSLRKGIKKRACFRIWTFQQRSDTLLSGVIDDSNWIVRHHNLEKTPPPCKIRDVFHHICSRHVATGWKMFLKYNAPSVITRLVTTFLKKLHRFIVDDLREFMYELTRLFMYIHWELNTTARRAIFTCSVVGFFSGCIAELLGAHATAPYWCFITGFVFGFFQNYVFRRLQKRISIFLNIQMPETA
jgi:hypothetical protein